MSTAINEHTDTGTPTSLAATAPVGPGGERRTNGASLAFFAVALAGMAVVAAMIAVGISLRALETAEDRVAAAGAAAASGPVTVTLTDFAISPSEIEVVAGSTLEVVNNGATVHNVEVEGIRSPDIPAGGTASLDISSLGPGSYELFCQIPGHKDLGMVATLNVG